MNEDYIINEDSEELFEEIDLSHFQHVPFRSLEAKSRASILNEEQKQFIQNMVAETAVKLVNLEVDPNNPRMYELGKAHYLGQIRALRYLIECSNLETTITEM